MPFDMQPNDCIFALYSTDAHHAIHLSLRLLFLQIIHFCSSPKPWEEANRKGDLEMMWWQRYVQMKMGSVPGMDGFV